MEKKILSFFLTSVLFLMFSNSLFSQSGKPSVRIEKYENVKTTQPNLLKAVNTQVPKDVLSGQNDNSRAVITVLPGNFSTSGNGRAPQGSRRYINTKYIISSAEIGGSGFIGLVTSVGWRWNVPSPPAATGPTAQSTATTGNLRVYLKDTVAGATTIGSNFIDTNGAGYTKVIDGTISIPAGLAEINIDVPTGGPGTSPYTPAPGSAVLVIFVYKTTTGVLATPTGAPNVSCINSPTNGLATFQSNSASPTNGQVGTFSAFRPETRFGNALVEAISIGPIYSLGEIGVCPCPDTNLVITNMYHLRDVLDTVIIKTTVKNVAGGATKWEFIDTIITDTTERWVVFYVFPKDGDTKKSDSIISEGRITGTEDITGNNRSTWLKKTTLNRWNQAEPTGITDGGVGFTGGTGDFVAGFFASCEIPICAVDVSFFAATGGGNQPYLVKIYGVDNDTLKPGALLYASTQQTSPPGNTGVAQRVTHYLPNPVNVPYGYYFVGLAQTDTINLSCSFQDESPIRFGTFFFDAPVGSGNWTDFAAAGADFLLDIAPKTYLTLNLGVWLEGNYNGLTMIPDTVTAIAHSQISPDVAYDTARAVVGSGGLGTFNFCKLNNDSCYYYEIRQRNHLATWSHSQCEKIDECGKLYDFRFSASQAYGNNMIFIPPPPGDVAGGGFGTYGGDVDQDGSIGLFDVLPVYNDNVAFVTGYVVTDINGDLSVTLADLLITYNNNVAFIYEIAP